MRSEPDTAVRWTVENVGRFMLIWLLAATAFIGTIDVVEGGDFGRPRSALAVVSVPLTLAALLAAVAMTAVIAMILVSPVVLAWLAVYLSALWWLGRGTPHAVVRIFAVALAPLLWVVFVHTDPPEVRYAALVTTCLFGVFARPRNGSPAVARLFRAHS
jgi:hypothetical protein